MRTAFSKYLEHYLIFTYRRSKSFVRNCFVLLIFSLGLTTCRNFLTKVFTQIPWQFSIVFKFSSTKGIWVNFSLKKPFLLLGYTHITFVLDESVVSFRIICRAFLVLFGQLASNSLAVVVTVKVVIIFAPKKLSPQRKRILACHLTYHHRRSRYLSLVKCRYCVVHRIRKPTNSRQLNPSSVTKKETYFSVKATK